MRHTRPPGDVPRGKPLCNYLHVYKNDQNADVKIITRGKPHFTYSQVIDRNWLIIRIAGKGQFRGRVWLTYGWSTSPVC